jgi:hypothetical protein
MSDLNRDPVIDWQIKLIGYGYVLLGLVIPASIGTTAHFLIFLS